MTTAFPDGAIGFLGRATGSTIEQNPPLLFQFNSAGSGNFQVTDGNSDGDADQATDFYTTSILTPPSPIQPYSGYTIEINGNDYAIFLSGSLPNAFFIIPYFSAVEDLSSLIGTSVSQTISFSGDNASVVNLCFVGGTLIATPRGERAVEDLAIGDLVTTRQGHAVPVKWVGRQMIKHPVNVTADETLAPVCITAGALGNHSDLYVSADHGMIVDGLVINASALVNGDTIRFVPTSEMPTAFTYYHIETEHHDAILANGAPSETFIDVASRTRFDNYQEYFDLYGTERIIPAQPLPRISSARLVPDAIKIRLGMAQHTAHERAIA